MAKEMKWKGMDEEEIKTLELKAFMKYVPARARRSLKRGFTEPQKSLLKRIQADNNNIKTHCRNMVIIPSMLGKLIRVYNGKDFVPVTIITDMLGHYLGEFSHTRRKVSHGSAGVGATRSSKAISAR